MSPVRSCASAEVARRRLSSRTLLAPPPGRWTPRDARFPSGRGPSAQRPPWRWPTHVPVPNCRRATPPCLPAPPLATPPCLPAPPLATPRCLPAPPLATPRCLPAPPLATPRCLPAPPRAGDED